MENYTFATNKRNTQKENGLKYDYLDFPYYVRALCTLLQITYKFTAKWKKCTKMVKCAIYSRTRTILKIFSHLNRLFVYEY